MCHRKVSTAIIACLILILLIPAISNVGALADSGKPVHKKAIIVQPGEEVIVTDIASGPSPQEAEATGLDAAGGKELVRNDGTVRADAGAVTTATAKGASAGARSVGIGGSGGKDSILNNGTLPRKRRPPLHHFPCSSTSTASPSPSCGNSPPSSGGLWRNHLPGGSWAATGTTPSITRGS